MKRTDADIARVAAEIGDHAAVLAQRYRALWDLERVLYQRFRYRYVCVCVCVCVCVYI